MASWSLVGTKSQSPSSGFHPVCCPTTESTAQWRATITVVTKEPERLFVERTILDETLTQMAFPVGVPRRRSVPWLSHRGAKVLLAFGSPAVLASGSSQACFLVLWAASLLPDGSIQILLCTCSLCHAAQWFSPGQDFKWEKKLWIMM